MNIKKIVALYFSPNGSTKEIVNQIAKGIGDYEVDEIDLTSKESREIKREFNKDDLVIIGFPVYADRLPSISGEIFENIKANNTPVIAIVSYGNREYGDALLELRDELIKRNMKLISGAAIIGQHCLNHNVAAGRPDEKDSLKILEYAKQIKDKIVYIEELEGIEDISIKGNYPYHPLKSQPTPIGDSKCIQCGLCEEQCPVEAIIKEDYRKTSSDICIFCGHCIDVCPTDARDIKEESFLKFMVKLESITAERKEIEVFL